MQLWWLCGIRQICKRGGWLEVWRGDLGASIGTAGKQVDRLGDHVPVCTKATPRLDMGELLLAGTGPVGSLPLASQPHRGVGIYLLTLDD